VEERLESIRERLADSVDARPGRAEIEAALERARRQIEELSAATAKLEAALPERVAGAVREGVQTEAAPVGRHLAEVRGLASQTIRRLERIETDLTAERYARLDDLELLVELFVSGWRGLEQRLERIEKAIEAGNGATVHRLETVTSPAADAAVMTRDGLN
jgi:hypothetical protein